MAARIQAKVLSDYVQLPETDKLWAEAMHWACEALNTLLVLLILTPNRRMRCGPVKLFLLDHIPSSQRIVGGSDRRKCCRRVKAVFT